MTVERGKLGLWMCTALVVGNMIGSGVFLLPASLAPYGLDSVAAWLLTAGGAMVLAVVFAGLGKAFPTIGGPYAYTRMAFGDLAGFIVAWGYWVSIWTGNAAIATGGVSYLGHMFPTLADQPWSALATVAMVWLFTAFNLLGARTAGLVQLVTTVLKLMPLLAVAGLGVWLLATHRAAVSQAVHAAPPLRLDAITAAAALTLWAFLGLESATIPAGKVHDPRRTIPRATLFGTALTAVVYILACTTVMALIPAERLAVSAAPFAEVAQMFWGSHAGDILAAFAAISAMGALNGWILLHGELPFQMSRQGVFPKIFGRESRRGAPAASLIIGSTLVSVMVLLNSSKSTVHLFTFVLLLATAVSLVMYLACALAALKLMASGRIAGARTQWGLALASLIAAAYALWAIAGAGIVTGAVCGAATICWASWSENPVYLGALLLALGVPVFYLMRRRNPSADPDATAKPA